MRSLFNGHYLITHTRHKFLDGVEIFLLLENEDGIRGYCVNAYVARDGGHRFESDPHCAKCLGDLHDAFVEANYRIGEAAMSIPLCFGGPDGKDEDYAFLHTGPGSFERMRVYSKFTYHVTPFREFVSGLVRPNPCFASCYAGYQRFSGEEIHQACVAGDWSLRVGLHHLAYSRNFHAKPQFVERLPVIRQPDSLDAMSVMQSLFHPLMMLAHERHITMARMTVHIYFDSIKGTPVDPTHADEIARVMLALTETEGKDVLRIAEEYTLSEIFDLYKKISANGIEIKLVKDFDDRKAMLEVLGLDSLHFDWSHYAAIFDGMNLENRDPPPGRAYTVHRLEARMEQISAAIRDPRAWEN